MLTGSNLNADDPETRTRARSRSERKREGGAAAGLDVTRDLLPPAGAARRGLGPVSIGRIAMWLGIACLVVATGTAGGAYLYFHESVAAVAAKTPEVRRAARQLDVPLPGQPAVALVIGYDHRKGDGPTASGRSDTLMLVRADPATDSISLLSFPRDMRVEIRCPGRTPYFDRINAAYANCGPQGSLQTVRALTGVQINYLITVNFRGFRQIVDRLDGAWIDVDRRYFNDRGGPFGYATINLRPGYQQLTGRQTLDYVRYRHTDSDLYRVARQQQFVKAFKGQVQESFAPIALPKVVNAITNNVEVAQGGGVDVDGRTVLSYALFAYGLPQGPRLPDEDRGPRGRERADHRLGEHHARDHDVHAPGRRVVGQGDRGRARREGEAAHPRHRARRRSPCSTATASRARRRPPGTSSVSARTRSSPRRTGFRRMRPRSTTSARRSTSTTSRRGAREAGRKVANLFASAELEPLPRKISQLANGAMLTVVVGQTFHGSLASAPIDQTPKRERPNIIVRAERRDRPPARAARARSRSRSWSRPSSSAAPGPTRRCPCACTGSTPARSTRPSGSSTAWARTSTGACR